MMITMAGLVDTAVKTAETGYMQRRLVKVFCFILVNIIITLWLLGIRGPVCTL